MIKLNLNDINTKTVEGKLVVAALGILATSDKSPDEILNSVCEMANQIYYENEIKLRDDVKSLITERLNQLYYSEPNQGVMPNNISNKINEKVEDILISLKELGLFKVD